MANEQLNILINVLKGQSESVLTGIQNQIIGIGAAYLSWQGAKATIEWTIGQAIESEKVWAGVAQSLDLTGQSAERMLPRFELFAQTIMQKTGETDESIGLTLETLMRYGMTAQMAMKTISVAVDVAAGRHKELGEVVNLLGKAYQGHTETLGRSIGVWIEASDKAEGFSHVLDKVAASAIGAADAAGKTASVQLKILKAQIDETGEALGMVFIPAVTGSVSWLNNYIEALGNSRGAMETATVALYGLLPGFGLFGDFLDNVNKEGRETATAINNIITSLDELGPAANNGMKPITVQAREIVDATRAAAEQQERLNKAVYEYIGIAPMQPILDELPLREEPVEFEMAGEKTISKLDWWVSSFKQAESTIVAFNKQSSDEFTEDWDRASTQSTNTMTADWQRFKKDFGPLATSMAAGLSGAFEGAGNYIANTLGDTFDTTRLKLKDIWKEMSGDFIRYFINEAIASIAGKFLGFLGKLFDNPTNDAMAGRQGYDFGTYFARGANQAIAATMSPLAGGGSAQGAGSPVIVIAGGGSVDMSAIYKEVERAANSKEISVVTRQTLAEAMRSVNAYGRA